MSDRGHQSDRQGRAYGIDYDHTKASHRSDRKRSRHDGGGDNGNSHRTFDASDDAIHQSHTTHTSKLDSRDGSASLSRSHEGGGGGGGESSERRKRQRVEEERQARMAQWRAENEREESGVANVAARYSNSGSGSRTEANNSQSDEEHEDETQEEKQTRLMQQMLGFGDFGSTKNTAVSTNQTTAATGVAAKNKARKYRQYMNRKNGFNRPLEKMD
jgi:U4/U6.U5 tri-snRNP-associated protein 3